MNNPYIPSAYLGAIVGLASKPIGRKRITYHDVHISKSVIKDKKSKRKEVRKARKRNRK
jgi:hypothetical protein